MENFKVTPKDSLPNKINKQEERINRTNSIIFQNAVISSNYLEIIGNDNQLIKLIFRSPEEIHSKNEKLYGIIGEKLNQFEEVKLIIDFERLSLELEIDELKSIIEKLYNNIEDIYNTKLSLIIKNSLLAIQENLNPILFANKLVLNKLEIDDELYAMSPILLDLFPSIEANELILRKFKFNSKSQLSKFYKFIINVGCKKLTLEDIFIELILKKDQNDDDYKDLDIYISYIEGVIVIDNNYTAINSLVMRDCPLFAITGNMFNYKESEYFKSIKRDIDIDETSLLNPFIITKFKIIDGKFDLCFDLDSFKLQLEEKGYNNDYDYIDYLDYIFNILISFKREGQKIVDNKKKEWEKDEDGLSEINPKYFHRLTFKNFDIKKLEYITGDEMTFIEEKNTIFNSEEKERKHRWEKFEEDLDNFEFEKLSEVKEVVFDNCTNFFIKWILIFIKGRDNEKKNFNIDFDFLKIKKCGKDYIDLTKILTYKIGTLILFDSPLIIGDNFPKDGPLLENVRQRGIIENLILKINSLDSYGKQCNLNTYKTLQIMTELIKNPKYIKNITFELSALSNLMTFLAYNEYLGKQNIYNDPNDDEDGNDDINPENKPKGKIDINNLIREPDNYLPKYMCFGSKKYRDRIYEEAFCLEALENSKIILKCLTIKKQTENFDNQNYLMTKAEPKGKNIKSYTDNNELKKIDFGSDGFFIDRDYKNFFSKNKIKTVELRNVVFSNYKDINLKDIEGETITNLISNNKYEEKSIEKNQYEKTHFPDYKIDVKTLNGIIYKNYLFDDIGVMFTYFMYKIEQKNNREGNQIKSEEFEKKNTLMDYFKKLKNLFQSFKKNIKQLTIIIDNVKELKELYCTLCVFKIILTKKWIKEKINYPGAKNPEIELPNKEDFEFYLGPYFLMEKNEEEKDCYSIMNYYYTSEEEEMMIKNKEFEIDGYTIKLEFDYDIFNDTA